MEIGRPNEAPRKRLRTWIAWGLCAPWLLFAVIWLFGLEWGSRPVELLAFTPYVAAAAAIPLIVAAVLRVWPAAALAAAVLVALAIELGEGSPQELIELVDELDVDVLSVEELTPGLASAWRLRGSGNCWSTSACSRAAAPSAASSTAGWVFTVRNARRLSGSLR